MMRHDSHDAQVLVGTSLLPDEPVLGTGGAVASDAGVSCAGVSRVGVAEVAGGELPSAVCSSLNALLPGVVLRP